MQSPHLLSAQNRALREDDTGKGWGFADRKITNHAVTVFSRIDEKGYFGFGGSTIIQLFKSGMVELHGDIRSNSENGTETLIKTGDRIARRIKC